MITIKIFLDKEGNWYYDGRLLINEKVIELFFKSLTYKNGSYYLVHNGEEKEISVEDAPYIAEGIMAKDDWLYLKIKGGLSFPMDGPVYFKSKIPYTIVNNLPVKFTRKAFWALSRYFTADGQKVIYGNFSTRIIEEGEGYEQEKS
ncbi:DUF1285 domain-containing protein [Carboxydothermus pertinax]|uniref:DUF1285 domain-containing protein n=1 Tax=Carboxydothermus pertinax TaxID=870242 RepID=A0A1L8CXG3_9THEO|nr:DUF1285 domain-containing protein [Carboxydothermus pertinax]GAV23564.1 hypothetical protein cpu_20740 [Carboxydothermus pertinax]